MANVCHFSSGSGCRFGNNCRFQHVNSISNVPVCRYYSMPGGCHNGSHCRFLHSQPLVSSSSFAPLQMLESRGGESDSESQPSDENALAQLDGAKCSSSLSSVDGSERCQHQLSANNAIADKQPSKKKKKKNKKPCSKRVLKTNTINVLERKAIKCGECQMMFDDEPSVADNFNALKLHYVEKFTRYDSAHTRLVRENQEVLKMEGNVQCNVCNAEFAQVPDLFQHIGGKSKDSDDLIAIAHRSYFDAIVLPFVERDAGFAKSTGMLLKRLRAMIINVWGDKLNDSDEGDIVISAKEKFLNPSNGKRMYRDSKKQNWANYMYDDDDSDTDDSDDDIGVYGFTNSDVEELLCQGVKPWDPEAYRVLDFLHGGCY